jgi:hypothetical protein
LIELVAERNWYLCRGRLLRAGPKLMYNRLSMRQQEGAWL